jgi:hypothetical protein
MLNPAIEVAVEGYTAGYWSAYQITGPDRDLNLRNGSGHEQDLYASYSGAVNDRLEMSAMLTGVGHAVPSAATRT